DFLKQENNMENVDDFDFICHIAYDKKPLTRKERADNVKKHDFFSKYSGVAREVLEALLDKYMNQGIREITSIDVLKLDPIIRLGKPSKIIKEFGGRDLYNSAIIDLQNAIYENEVG
ncbi:MAG: type I restriction-modification enzyme R subunit C-terminal domain-containing protein, partial [Finegoldia magna]|nr:type I restriction-modification enzyme R subunit C-terminal domain-containing protein [Finegoldia magna]